MPQTKPREVDIDYYVDAAAKAIDRMREENGGLDGWIEIMEEACPHSHTLHRIAVSLMDIFIEHDIERNALKELD